MENVRLIKRSFVRQSGEDDCGLACLMMVLHYVGQITEAAALKNVAVPPGGFSLLDLKRLAQEHGLDCRVVQVELSFLRTHEVPCILHTQTALGGAHFEICYGARKSGSAYRYFIADPAYGAGWQQERELTGKLKTRAALLFPRLSADLSAFAQPSWHLLWSYCRFPSGMLAGVPLLAAASAFAGVAMSWTLQKGMNDDAIFRSHVIIIVLLLLFLISVFRSVISYLRQYILLRIETTLHQQLTRQMMEGFFLDTGSHFPVSQREQLSATLLDMHKVKLAIINLLSALLPDGLMIVFLLAAVWCYLPLAGLINLVYLAVVMASFIWRMPVYSFALAHASHLGTSAENLLLKDAGRLPALAMAGLLKERITSHLTNHMLHTASRNRLMLQMMQHLLSLEVLGAASLTGVWMAGLYEWGQLLVSYNVLAVTVVLSYLMTTLIPKIQTSLLVIADGAAAAVQFKARLTPPVPRKG
ncbi:hypothetical protein KHS38_14140 [Mucilaginibacter sp. Bleaf8]|uniref:cysteine peptidase family C39 domain-containing protein n=1 Tax=Mucilaginibacter sp. Bleaf8 TaxID=2834430 RepID=UPI001BD00C81|nr:cysteine peptidase family C39 domain-containing protein [Mucilaginibacter sp. Bleaf8]MBS7565549.1 hypothetical protein [Mucilaginibacter sp. Bleaf8]